MSVRGDMRTKQKTGAPADAGSQNSCLDRLTYELALSTVTERRFCDQHEMSLHTATGRSLP